MIEKWYEHLWKDICHQKQPFTFSIRDSWSKHKIFWFIGTLIAGVTIGHTLW